MKNKPNQRTKDSKVRIPRPLGFTLAIQSLNQQKQENKDDNQAQLTKVEYNNKLTDIKNLLIDNYIAQGFQLNNKPMNVQELSNYLNLPIDHLIRRMSKGVMRVVNAMTEGNGQELARVASFQAFFGTLNIGAEAMAQLNVLKAHQKGRYVAFASAEVNKAVANIIAAGKLQKDTAEMLFNMTKLTNPGTNILNNGTLIQSQNGQYFDPEKAALYLEKNGYQSALESPQILNNLVPESQLSSLPEVRANMQDLRGIGIKHDGTQEGIKGTQQASDGMAQQSEIRHPNEHHQDRRQRDLGIVDEEDLVED